MIGGPIHLAHMLPIGRRNIQRVSTYLVRIRKLNKKETFRTRNNMR